VRKDFSTALGASKLLEALAVAGVGVSGTAAGAGVLVGGIGVFVGGTGVSVAATTAGSGVAVGSSSPQAARERASRAMNSSVRMRFNFMGIPFGLYWLAAVVPPNQDSILLTQKKILFL